LFEKLFPQFLEEIGRCREFVNEVIYSIIAKLKNQASSANNVIDKTARKLLEKIKITSKTQSDVESMVRDFIYSIDNSLIFYEPLF
jgi:hypothetical protein